MQQYGISTLIFWNFPFFSILNVTASVSVWSVFQLPVGKKLAKGFATTWHGVPDFLAAISFDK